MNFLDLKQWYHNDTLFSFSHGPPCNLNKSQHSAQKAFSSLELANQSEQRDIDINEPDKAQSLEQPALGKANERSWRTDIQNWRELVISGP